MARRMAKRLSWLCLPLGLAMGITGCRQDMHDQPKLEAFEFDAMASDGRSARAQVEGTVARGGLELDELLYTGKESGEFAKRFPFSITATDLRRGQERYGIYCAVCHDHAGTGQGLAVARGMRQPLSFHDDSLSNAAPGFFFDAMTHGFGAMLDLADRVTPEDRWRIVAYIQALRVSQAFPIEDLNQVQRQKLEAEQ